MVPGLVAQLDGVWQLFHPITGHVTLGVYLKEAQRSG